MPKTTNLIIIAVPNIRKCIIVGGLKLPQDIRMTRIGAIFAFQFKIDLIFNKPLRHYDMLLWISCGLNEIKQEKQSQHECSRGCCRQLTVSNPLLFASQ